MKKRFITFVLTVAMITVIGLAAEAGPTTKQITITDQDIQIVSVDTVTVYFYDEDQDSIDTFTYYVADNDLV